MYIEVICFFKYLSNRFFFFFPPSRFLFTDYNRLSSVGGETSMAEMIATLSDACEREFGFLATRLFRVFKTEDSQGRISPFFASGQWWGEVSVTMKIGKLGLLYAWL